MRKREVVASEVHAPLAPFMMCHEVVQTSRARQTGLLRPEGR
ncbi:hypothetical protein IQ17_00700 [Bradyrhizobium daqingense]|uniref:Uncharacterized protein n=1 Tax=Bradyrhizobium daqingense TaxID=993502 RepID=A0A562LPW9_9BRAD|nr:hypothetical protein IQ17_00700 [Bradyrhizobium daqingense]